MVPAENLSAGCVAAAFSYRQYTVRYEKGGIGEMGLQAGLQQTRAGRDTVQTPCMNLQSAFPRVSETAGGVHLSSREHRVWSVFRMAFGLAT